MAFSPRGSGETVIQGTIPLLSFQGKESPKLMDRNEAMTIKNLHEAALEADRRSAKAVADAAAASNRLVDYLSKVVEKYEGNKNPQQVDATASVPAPSAPTPLTAGSTPSWLTRAANA